MDSYLLLGYGLANMEVGRHFKKEGIPYTVYDDYVLKYKRDVDYNSFSKIIKSSGIDPNHFIINHSLRLGKEVLSDLELFYRMTTKEKLFITVTGTNGKTTTASLIAHLLGNVDLGGNIGVPLFQFIHSKQDIVIEASSYMLEDCLNFRSYITVFLNISPHHLDRHQTMEEYLRVKLKLIQNKKAGDIIIYNYDDDVLKEKLSHINGAVPFSVKKKVTGFYYENERLYHNENLILKGEEIPLLGNHNIANTLAAIAAVYAYKGDLSGVRDLIKTYKTAPYRISYVGSRSGIKFYNDSKATNYAALNSALETFAYKNVLLIAGGVREEGNLSVLDSNIECIKRVFVDGENREELKQYFESKKIAVNSFLKLDDALDEVFAYLNGIDVVLFSPGAASFDQFTNYKKRGDLFSEWFNKKMHCE